MDAGKAHAYLVAQGHPVIGVRIGVIADRQTWDVQCAAGTPAATVDAARAALRTATDQVILDAATDADAGTAINGGASARAIKTTVIWTLRRVLGRAPTPAEIQTARTEWIAVFKSLG